MEFCKIPDPSQERDIGNPAQTLLDFIPFDTGDRVTLNDQEQAALGLDEDNLLIASFCEV